tara:strand:- start:10440 stop:11072 length:633 start_codon:yes stop_codon:yes gene_type:complete
MENNEPNTLPHSALNTQIGADANLGLLLLTNGYDYFNFPGLIDAYLDYSGEGENKQITLNVLHTGALQENIASDSMSHEVVSPSGIRETVFATNPDFEKHFAELIETSPSKDEPSLVNRMETMLEKMKLLTPSEAVAQKQAEMEVAMQMAQQHVNNKEAESAIITPGDSEIPASGVRKFENPIEGVLPDTINEGLKQHLREKQGSDIIQS